MTHCLCQERASSWAGHALFTLRCNSSSREATALPSAKVEAAPSGSPILECPSKFLAEARDQTEQRMEKISRVKLMILSTCLHKQLTIRIDTTSRPHKNTKQSDHSLSAFMTSYLTYIPTMLSEREGVRRPPQIACVPSARQTNSCEFERRARVRLRPSRQRC